uniref:Succinate dehydrogenase assembly factor 3 n=1 Tax=Oncorhynchus kisutch TaxID=8019 RepID=A0A8C7M9M1_ONCKI
MDLRALGDQYVKDEFRRNKTAAPEEPREWAHSQFCLRTQNSLRGDLKVFQDEQVGQLYDLMLESTKPNRQFAIQGDGFKK